MNSDRGNDNRGSNAFGMVSDLVSLNVRRGREHGIPDYNTVRTFCGLPKATSFEDLSNEIEQPSKAAVVAPSFILMIFFSVNLLLY
jgi:hypothetical protein